MSLVHLSKRLDGPIRKNRFGKKAPAAEGIRYMGDIEDGRGACRVYGNSPAQLARNVALNSAGDRIEVKNDCRPKVVESGEARELPLDEGEINDFISALQKAVDKPVRGR